MASIDILVLAYKYNSIHDLCQHLHLALLIQPVVVGQILQPFDWHVTTN